MYKLIKNQKNQVEFDFTRSKISSSNQSQIKFFSKETLYTVLFYCFVSSIFIGISEYTTEKQNRLINKEYSMPKNYAREELAKKHVMEILEVLQKETKENYRFNIRDVQKENYLNKNAYDGFISSIVDQGLINDIKKDKKIRFQMTGFHDTVMIQGGASYNLESSYYSNGSGEIGKPYVVINVPFKEIVTSGENSEEFNMVAHVTIQDDIIVDFKMHKWLPNK